MQVTNKLFIFFQFSSFQLKVVNHYEDNLKTTSKKYPSSLSSVRIFMKSLINSDVS